MSDATSGPAKHHPPATEGTPPNPAAAPSTASPQHRKVLGCLQATQLHRVTWGYSLQNSNPRNHRTASSKPASVLASSAI